MKPNDAFIHESAGGKRSFIPNAIEFGHAGPGDTGGKVAAPIPFQRSAYEEKRRDMSKKLERDMIQAIERAAKVR